MLLIPRGIKCVMYLFCFVKATAANCLDNLKIIAEAQEKTLNEIEKILIGHFTELLGHRPKMAKHILKT